jgi:L-rhamnose mutarotase
MIRKAFLMKVNEDAHEEYWRRHNAIWSDLQAVLKQHGVHNYSIFLERETSQLFAYAEIDTEQLWQQISKTETCQRWWAFMSDLMLTNADNSPKSTNLDEVFHLD